MEPSSVDIVVHDLPQVLLRSDPQPNRLFCVGTQRNPEEQQAKSELKRSAVADNESAKSKLSEVQTSSGMFIAKGKNADLEHLNFYWIGTPSFHGHGRRTGRRWRKSVHRCIVSPDLSVLNLVIVKKCESKLPGPTHTDKPRLRGPNRASKIYKLFNISRKDNVQKYVNTYRWTFIDKAGRF
ncbi:hypothetical protein RHSIM_Rhsim07G0112000 [Rhododendron simsii]|uniref:40S ribosomal protein S6 n=1 Tax=Rhododendron simsii TaxID=118357 RepID=A0A834GPH0_RHOSS|nr:hypothetical protein RHSIM_Rhsim07G0112000 [Rhododendron simsii]